MTALNYEERNAIATLRKSMVRKPEIVRELFKGMAREVITHALLQTKDEMAALLAVNQAMQAAAREFLDKEKQDATHQVSRPV